MDLSFFFQDHSLSQLRWMWMEGSRPGVTFAVRRLCGCVVVFIRTVCWLRVIAYALGIRRSAWCELFLHLCAFCLCGGPRTQRACPRSLTVRLKRGMRSFLQKGPCLREEIPLRLGRRSRCTEGGNPIALREEIPQDRGRKSHCIEGVNPIALKQEIPCGRKSLCNEVRSHFIEGGNPPLTWKRKSHRTEGGNPYALWEKIPLPRRRRYPCTVGGNPVAMRGDILLH